MCKVIKEHFNFTCSFIQKFAVIYLNTFVRQLSEIGQKYSFFPGWYCSSPDQTIKNSTWFLLIRCLAAEKYKIILHLLIFFAEVTSNF